MSFLENLNKIEDHLEKIKKVNITVLNSGKFSTLELDLVKQHLRELYELYDKLSSLKLSENTVSETKSDAVKAVNPVEQVQEQNKVVEKQPTVEVVEEANKVVAEKQEVESVHKESKPVEEDIISNEELKNSSPELDNKEAAEIILESQKENISLKTVEVHKTEENKPQESPISLFEKYQKKPEKSEVNTKSRVAKPMKQLIGINDKFTFIKVLFDNSVAKYDEVVAKIDTLESKKEALQYFETNVWNGKNFEEKDELIERVEAILEAKFAS